MSMAKMTLAQARELYRAPATPRRAKIALALLVVYLLCPIDIVPDFIPVLGQLDDVIIAGLVIAYITRVIHEQEQVLP
jgi:uncharacterized membrane protein YkvA (DUF1232 family)